MRRSNRFTALFILLALVLSLGFSAAASLAVPLQAFAATASQSSSGAKSGVYDDADLLTDSQEQALADRISSYTAKYSCDIAIVTTSDAGGKTSQAYADAYAEKLGMSMIKEGYPGILFLIDMDNRQIYISTSGQAIGYYSDSRVNTVLDDCYGPVSGQDYYGSCRAFLNGVHSYMGISPSKSGRMGLFGILVRLAVSLAAGALITLLMVKRAGGRVTTTGATYLDASASRITGQTDRFINKTVTQRVIPRNTGGDGGGGGMGGGGGSFHTSSGGGVHGGGGRGF